MVGWVIEKVLDEAAQLIHKTGTSYEAEIRNGVLLLSEHRSPTPGSFTSGIAR